MNFANFSPSPAFLHCFLCNTHTTAKVLLRLAQAPMEYVNTQPQPPWRHMCPYIASQCFKARLSDDLFITNGNNILEKVYDSKLFKTFTCSHSEHFFSKKRCLTHVALLSYICTIFWSWVWFWHTENER